MMDWLSGLVGQNAAQIISFIGLFVLFLIGVFAVYAVIKRMTAGTYVSKNHNAAPRLTVTDAAAVDGQRRLVLVRRDDVEHLILIGGPSDIVIEQNITRNKRDQNDDTSRTTLRTHKQEERTHVTTPQFVAQIPAAEQEYNALADIQSALQNFRPEPEVAIARPRTEAPIQAPSQAQVKPATPVQPAPSPSQPLQTNAQQVAAARQQQQAAQQRNPQQAQRPVAPRSMAPTPAAANIAEPTEAKLHPVYPLGQVSRGVIAATSGLAAANNAAQQELIAAAKRENRTSSPSLDDVRPGTNQNAEGSSLVLQRATPQLTRPS